jgi:hypothetical protein
MTYITTTLAAAAFATRCAAFDAHRTAQSMLHSAHYFTGSASEVAKHLSNARAAAISAYAAYILARDADAAAYALQCDTYRAA